MLNEINKHCLLILSFLFPNAVRSTSTSKRLVDSEMFGNICFNELSKSVFDLIYFFGLFN